MAEGRAGLGRFSKWVYLVLVVAFCYSGVTYELERIDLMEQSGGSGLSGALLASWEALRNEFFIVMGSIVVLGVVWNRVVKREKRKHPERYLRYSKKSPG